METLEDLFSIEVSFMTTSDKHKQQPRNPDYIDYKRVEDHRAAMEAGGAITRIRGILEEQQEQPLVGAKASELANYIFTTPELLVLILTHLSGADLLRVASISSSFHENIKRSPALQRNLNFSPRY
ncbi:hypothetical protein LTR09_000808 [Extremus antarcticus]|uniref:F-box domain-containing protein n=1 Tax=Extremus antarcticus TaxID=702011 RepID=A0AAJ0GKB9_9PEZI|nr:hypothetical protein LTR09_000808 [Extremus antarcticus]